MATNSAAHRPNPRHVVIVSGGPCPHPAVLAVLPADPFVIAVDLGHDHARTLGLPVDAVVGDLDSISPASIDALSTSGATVHRHPVDKDATDLELALELAVSMSPLSTTVIAGSGWDDRFDHVAAQLGLLASPRWSSIDLHAYVGLALVRVVHGPGTIAITGPVGSLLSIVPVGGACHGVRTTGLRFSLHDEPLDPFATRGVSNEVASPDGSIELRSGHALVIAPHALGLPATAHQPSSEGVR